MPQCCPAPTRTDRPRTFGYPCCGPCRFAGCRRRSGKHPRGTAYTLVLFSLPDWRMPTFPVSCSSSLVFFDASTSTPGLMVTLRTSFSPTKFLISTSNWSVSLFFSMLTLMGKLKTLLVAGREMPRVPKDQPSLRFARGRHTGHRRNASCINVSMWLC